MIEIASFEFNVFQENTYVAWDETLDCLIVDPGCHTHTEQQHLEHFIDSKKLKPVALVNTHCHIDHVLGNVFIMERYGLPLLMHPDEIFTYKSVGQWAAMFGLGAMSVPENRLPIEPGVPIAFGKSAFVPVLTPGHSIASVTLFNELEKLALVGDVIFKESIGRTDLPGGNYQTLISSIKNNIMLWDDDVKLFPGHGPVTTVGHERTHNPFLFA